MEANSDKGRAPSSEPGDGVDPVPVIPSGGESTVVLEIDDESVTTDWQRRVLGRSLRSATKKSIDRGASLILTAAHLLEKSNGDGFTVQDVADEAGQSLLTLYLYYESKDDLLFAVFEEAMKTYARLIRESVVDLDDELERLAGTILAATLMPSHRASTMTPTAPVSREFLRSGRLSSRYSTWSRTSASTPGPSTGLASPVTMGRPRSGGPAGGGRRLLPVSIPIGARA